MLAVSDRTSLVRAVRMGVIAMALLVLAGLRHHLIWGNSPKLPFRLRPWLDALETSCVVAFACLAAVAWWRGMAALRHATLGPRRLLVLSWPLLVTAILVPPFLSADVVDYVMRGRILGVHGANPYVSLASAFATDPFVGFGDAGWKDFPMPYGPLIADLQGGVAWVAHCFSFLPLRTELVLAVLLFKLLFAACLVASAFVARDIAARLRPGSEDVAFVGVLWNPLLLNECVAQTHNEAVLLLLMLLMVRALLAGRAGVGAFALGLGVLTKIVPVVLAPLLLVLAWRTRRARPLLLGASAALLLTAWWTWRFFLDPGALDFLRRQSAVVGASLAWGVSRATGVGIGELLVVGRAVVAAVVLALCVRVWRRPDPDVLLHCAAAALLTTIALGLANLGAWYHVWWAPLALLGRDGWLRRCALSAVVMAPIGYAVWTATRAYDDRFGWVQLSVGLLLPVAAATVWRPRAAAIPPPPVAPSMAPDAASANANADPLAVGPSATANASTSAGTSAGDDTVR